jgi:hypothetical protein
VLIKVSMDDSSELRFNSDAHPVEMFLTTAAIVSLLHCGELQMFVNQLLMGGTSEDDAAPNAAAIAGREDPPKQIAALEFSITPATALSHSLESARWL